MLTSVNWGLKSSRWRGGISFPEVTDLPSSPGPRGAVAAPGKALAGVLSSSCPGTGIDGALGAEGGGNVRLVLLGKQRMS